jgi:hypothetical protein
VPRSFLYSLNRRRTNSSSGADGVSTQFVRSTELKSPEFEKCAGLMVKSKLRTSMYPNLHHTSGIGEFERVCAQMHETASKSVHDTPVDTIAFGTHQAEVHRSARES